MDEFVIRNGHKFSICAIVGTRRETTLGKPHEKWQLSPIINSALKLLSVVEFNKKLYTDDFKIEVKTFYIFIPYLFIQSDILLLDDALVFDIDGLPTQNY